MRKIRIIAAYRILTELLVLAAVTVQLMYGISNNPQFSIANYLSFFTIESNIIGALVFGLSGVLLIAGKAEKSDYLRGAATLYMVITGVVYILLLSNADVQTPIPWVNAVLHYIFPLIILADWIANPPKNQIAFKRCLVWLVFPISYAVYSLVRGHFTNWYPYPFLNVDQLGYLQVITNTLFVALGGVVLASIIYKLQRLRGN